MNLHSLTSAERFDLINQANEDIALLTAELKRQKAFVKHVLQVELLVTNLVKEALPSKQLNHIVAGFNKKDNVMKLEEIAAKSQPHGYFGEWDYPNAQWARQPTLADVPDICAQKIQRDPHGNLWQSHEECAKWLRDRAVRLGLAL